MKTIRVSATDARNNFFQLFNQVIYEGVQVIIQKAGVAKKVVLMPQTQKEKEDEKIIERVRKTYGALRDVPLSHFRDDRIHGKRAKAFLDKLRRGDV